MGDLFDTAVPMDHARLKAAVCALCEEFCLTTSTVGYSILGRDIPIVRVGQGNTRILYIGAHHASEWLTATALLKFCERLCTAARAQESFHGADAKALLRSHCLFIIPMLNPDGVEIELRGAAGAGLFSQRVRKMNGSDDFTHWQANARGVDLNHNYDAGFERGKALEIEQGILGGGPTRFGGEFPESEPESAALCALVRAVKFDFALALHSQGEEIYYDFLGSAPKNAREISESLASCSGYTLGQCDGFASFSGFKDWFVSEFERPCFTVEMGTGKNPLPAEKFWEYYPRCEAVLAGLMGAQTIDN